MVGLWCGGTPTWVPWASLCHFAHTSETSNCWVWKEKRDLKPDSFHYECLSPLLPRHSFYLSRPEAFGFPEAGWGSQEAHCSCTTDHILPELLLWTLNPAGREGSSLGTPYSSNRYVLMIECLWEGEKCSTQNSYWSCHFNIWTSKEKSANEKISSPPLRSLNVWLAFIFW